MKLNDVLSNVNVTPFPLAKVKLEFPMGDINFESTDMDVYDSLGVHDNLDIEMIGTPKNSKRIGNC